MASHHSRGQFPAPTDPAQHSRLRVSIALQIDSHVVEPRLPTIHVARLLDIQPRSTTIEEMHVETGPGEILATAVIPAAVARNAMYEHDTTPGRRGGRPCS